MKIEELITNYGELRKTAGDSVDAAGRPRENLVDIAANQAKKDSFYKTIGQPVPSPSPSPKPIIKLNALQEDYDELVGGVKMAFVPNPEILQQLQQQEQQAQQGSPQQGQPAPAPGGAAQQGQPAPAAPQQGGQPGDSGLMAQVLQAAQQLPPDAQQQVMPLLQQLQQMPPAQRDQQLQAMLQELHQEASQGGAGGQAPQPAPAQGVPADQGQPITPPVQPPQQPQPQAQGAMPMQPEQQEQGNMLEALAEEMEAQAGLDVSNDPEKVKRLVERHIGRASTPMQIAVATRYLKSTWGIDAATAKKHMQHHEKRADDPMAAMMGGGDPSMQQPPQGAGPEMAMSGGDAAQSAEASAIDAKNELDNVRVTLTVRELLDLIGKGSATASLLKVKQLADAHNQKMEGIKQKAEMEQQKQQQEQQAAAQQAQQGMMSGGIYQSGPMDANAQPGGSPAPAGGQPPAQ